MSGCDRGLVSDQLSMRAGYTVEDSSYGGAGRRCETAEGQWGQQSPGNRLLAREHVKADKPDRALASPQLTSHLSTPGPQANRDISVGY